VTANNDESVISAIRFLRRNVLPTHPLGFAVLRLSPRQESEYQKQNLRHCCGRKLPPMVGVRSLGQELPDPWFIPLIPSSIFLTSPNPIATNF
jgi:hypothetical protein